ncbi:MAG TPA: hypothetical protein VL200_12910 [Lacunisphaera sp.]|jgi:ElaB/YqjD/DUF883 family membrane-anchored ribosome-binding protein|nr:hypothetical protein [Lacunisphaera sp.]
MKNRNSAEIQTPEAILHDLRTLVTEAEKLMGSAVSENAEGTMDALRSRYDAAQERISELYASARKNVTAGAKYTDEAIRANPYQSLAIALGAGLLVGVLIGRSTK